MWSESEEEAEKRYWKSLKKRLHEEWIKNKILECSVRGLGMGRAMQIAQKMGFDPKPLIFGRLIKQKGEMIVGVIFATNEEREDEDYEFARWNSFQRFWEDVKKAVSEHTNVWVQIGTENTETLKDRLQSPIVIKGKRYDEWERKWKDA